MSAVHAAVTRDSGGVPSGAVSITDQYVSKITNGSVSGTATYRLASDGNVYSHTGAVLEQWALSGAAGDYESRATLQSGDAPTSGTMDTWQALSSDRSWSLSSSPGGFLSGIVLIEIRDVATSTVQDSASIQIEVDTLGSG